MVIVLTALCSTGFLLCYFVILCSEERGYSPHIIDGQWYLFKKDKNHGLPHLGQATKHIKCSSKQAIHYSPAGKMQCHRV